MRTTHANLIHDFGVEVVAGLFAKSRSGRVILHTLCLLRHPAHCRWHWQGILRELQG